MSSAPGLVRLAAVGDLHCHKKSRGKLRPLFAAMAKAADVLLLCGDLTDYGLPEEAEFLVEELTVVADTPVIAVLGNHDYESDRAPEVQRILADAQVTVLDNDSCEVAGIGFAGVKGFAGGFEGRSLEPWGEPIIKQFVHTAVDEALKLERALARLNTPVRVVLLHYSPVRHTVEGEPLEIHPFLGSRRLEDPLNRFHVQWAFHGHAHFGSLEGTTTAGARVFNVAMPLLAKHYPHQPFRLIEVPVPRE